MFKTLNTRLIATRPSWLYKVMSYWMHVIYHTRINCFESFNLTNDSNYYNYTNYIKITLSALTRICPPSQALCVTCMFWVILLVESLLRGNLSPTPGMATRCSSHPLVPCLQSQLNTTQLTVVRRPLRSYLYMCPLWVIIVTPLKNSRAGRCNWLVCPHGE